jgi:hypothetical protein
MLIDYAFPCCPFSLCEFYAAARRKQGAVHQFRLEEWARRKKCALGEQQRDADKGFAAKPADCMGEELLLWRKNLARWSTA